MNLILLISCIDICLLSFYNDRRKYRHDPYLQEGTTSQDTPQSQTNQDGLSPEAEQWQWMDLAGSWGRESTEPGNTLDGEGGEITR